jgi:hypothetical protein
VDGEASTAELVQKFQRALPPQQSPLFKGLNFPQMVLLMLCLAEVYGEASTAELVQSFVLLYPLSRVPSSRLEFSTYGFVDGV